jgi:predicted ATPase
VTEQLKIIGNQFINNLINESLANLSKSNGSILVLSGESGFGKTHIINYYYEKYKQKSTFKTVTTEAQYPIGNFNLGNLQPLYPFSKAIENILKDQNITPEKRFAKNLGLTVLASIPLIDTVFYAVKEIGKDWRQFKQEIKILIQ